VTRPDGSSAAPRRRAAAGSPEDQLVVRLAALRDSPDGEPDPAFRAATRARLLAMAAVRSPAPPARTGLRGWLVRRPAGAVSGPWRSRLTAGLAGAAATVTVLATLAGVSSGAAPGDPLYALKRGTEQTRLALAGDSRGQTLLRLASTRLDELGDLLAGGTGALPAGEAPAHEAPAHGAPAHGAPADEAAVLADGASARLVDDTLRTMDQQTAEGVAWLTERAVRDDTATPLAGLRTWTTKQSTGLTALVPAVPDGAREAVVGSLALLAQVSSRRQGLESALTCPAGPATAGSDALGPLPADCVATPSSASAGRSGGGSTSPPEPGAGSSAPVDAGTPPASGSGSAATTTVATTAGSGSGSAAGGSAGTGTQSAPGSAVPTTPRLPVPPLPIPLPGTGGGSAANPSTTSAPATTTPPLVHLPLPICLPPLLC
jgi:hypothetical protein